MSIRVIQDSNINFVYLYILKYPTFVTKMIFQLCNGYFWLETKTNRDFGYPETKVTDFHKLGYPIRNGFLHCRLS